MNKETESEIMSFDDNCRDECECYEEGETNNAEVADAGEILAQIRARHYGETTPLKPSDGQFREQAEDILSEIRRRSVAMEADDWSERSSRKLEEIRKVLSDSED